MKTASSAKLQKSKTKTMSYINQPFNLSTHEVWVDKNNVDIVVYEKGTTNEVARESFNSEIGVEVSGDNFYFRDPSAITPDVTKTITKPGREWSYLYFDDVYHHKVGGGSSTDYRFIGCDDLDYGKIKVYEFDIAVAQVNILFNGGKVTMKTTS